MDFIADGGILTNTSFKLAPKPLAKEHDCHPSIAGKMQTGICFERRTNFLLNAARWRRVGSDLGTDSVEIRIAERHAKKAANLSDTV